MAGLACVSLLLLIGGSRALTGKMEIHARGQAKKLRNFQQSIVKRSPADSLAPTFTLTGGPFTHATLNASTLTSDQWPEDYCIDFDLKFPKETNGNQDGFGGAVALLDSHFISVTHTSKLLGGDGDVGLVALIQGDPEGPYFASPGLGPFGSRHKATFCYKQMARVAAWNVDGQRVQGGYLQGGGASFPTSRNGSLSIFTGSHTNDTLEAMAGDGELYSFDIRPWHDSPPFRLLDVPVTLPKKKAARTNAASFPNDYCVDFNLTFPSTKNDNVDGIEGTVVTLGDLSLVVTHTTKLHGALHTGSFGLAALVGSGGAVFSTKGFAKPGSRHTASFCLKKSTGKPHWSVDSKYIQTGYKGGDTISFPDGRVVDMTLLSGSHTSSSEKALVGANLHSLEIVGWRKAKPLEGLGPVTVGYPDGVTSR